MRSLSFFTDMACGIVKLFLFFFDLNFGNFALPEKNPVYAASKHFNENCKD